MAGKLDVGSDGHEPITALAAATAEDSAAVLRPSLGEEPVLAHAALLGGLVGPFHNKF